MESEATEAAATAPPAAGEGGAPFGVALSLACFGCGRLPSEMGDGRVKHDVCPICVKLKVPTTYWCCVACPGNPAAWKRHAVLHKAVNGLRKRSEDGGVMQQQQREIAEEQARIAAQSGDEYVERYTEVVVRLGLVGPQRDGLTIGPGCSARVLLGKAPRALSQQLRVIVARLRHRSARLVKSDFIAGAGHSAAARS